MTDKPSKPTPRPVTGGAGSNPGKPVMPGGNKGKGGAQPPKKENN